jgi:hypothetical protein
VGTILCFCLPNGWEIIISTLLADLKEIRKIAFISEGTKINVAGVGSYLLGLVMTKFM